MRPPAVIASRVALALLGALGCERQEVSLGDDTPLLGVVDAAAIAEPEDAGDWRDDHHEPLSQDAGGFQDDDFECGFCAPGCRC